MTHFQDGNGTQEHELIFLKLIFRKRVPSKQNKVPTAKVSEVSLKLDKTSQFRQKKKICFLVPFFFSPPFHFNVYP